MHKLRAKMTDAIVKREVFVHFDTGGVRTLKNQFPSRRPRSFFKMGPIFQIYRGSFGTILTNIVVLCKICFSGVP